MDQSHLLCWPIRLNIIVRNLFLSNLIVDIIIIASVSIVLLSDHSVLYWCTVVFVSHNILLTILITVLAVRYLPARAVLVVLVEV